jgi:hypothetical protein
MARTTETFRKPMAAKGPLAHRYHEGEAYTDDGEVWRWTINNHCCPLDACQEYGIPVDEEAQRRALATDHAAFAAAYRQNDKGPSDEQRVEARAAHGPGVTLANVVTGRRWTT